MSFPGNEVERAQAALAHQQRRLKAEAADYVAIIPAEGFGFRIYDLAGKKLVLDTDRGFFLGEGAQIVVSGLETPLAFDLPPDVADGILKSHIVRRIALRLVFRPAPSELRRDGCIHLSGGRLAKAQADVLSYALLDREGAPVARGETTSLSKEADATAPVTAPRVTIGRPRHNDGRDVSDAVFARAAAFADLLLPCYRKSIETRPALRGTLVLALQILADGRIGAIISSHILDDIEALCDRVAFLHEGRLLAHDLLEALTARSDDALVVRFQGENDAHLVSYRDGRWHCSCDFFSSGWGLCSHTMAMEKILAEMLPKEALSSLKADA
jgi:hypothetical protein